MGIQAPAEVKYGLILEAVRQDGNLLNISALCRIAGVSRSGYYAWLDAAPLRQSREETDSADFALVKQAYVLSVKLREGRLVKFSEENAA